MQHGTAVKVSASQTNAWLRPSRIGADESDRNHLLIIRMHRSALRACGSIHRRAECGWKLRSPGRRQNLQRIAGRKMKRWLQILYPSPSLDCSVAQSPGHNLQAGGQLPITAQLLLPTGLAKTHFSV
jgi:hypothetical protein